MSGVDRNTPDPARGEIVEDAQGEPNVDCGPVREETELALYQRLHREHRLAVRVAMTWWLDVQRPEADLKREIQAAPYTTGGDHWLRFMSCKVNMDGGMTIGTAYQRQPYAGGFGGD